MSSLKPSELHNLFGELGDDLTDPVETKHRAPNSSLVYTLKVGVAKPRLVLMYGQQSGSEIYQRLILRAAKAKTWSELQLKHTTVRQLR